VLKSKGYDLSIIRFQRLRPTPPALRAAASRRLSSPAFPAAKTTPRPNYIEELDSARLSLRRSRTVYDRAPHRPKRLPRPAFIHTLAAVPLHVAEGELVWQPMDLCRRRRALACYQNYVAARNQQTTGNVFSQSSAISVPVPTVLVPISLRNSAPRSMHERPITSAETLRCRLIRGG
jgi:hypothetical protein